MMLAAEAQSGQCNDLDDVTSPRRRCIVTGAVKDKDELLRFVIDPERRLVADIEQRMPGRGIWLSADRETLKKACAKNTFAKAARANVVVPDELVEQVEKRLTRHCLNMIGLARRAGQAVFGFEKARDWFRSGRAGLLLIAADASPHARSKVRAFSDAEALVVPLTASELGVVAGRERSVHVVIAPGALARRVRREGLRLAGIRRMAEDQEAARGTASGSNGVPLQT